MEDDPLTASRSVSERQSFAPSAWLSVLNDLAECGDDAQAVDHALEAVTRSIASHVGDGALILRVSGDRLDVVAASHQVEPGRLQVVTDALSLRVEDALVVAMLGSTEPLRLSDLAALTSPSLSGHSPSAVHHYLTARGIGDVLALAVTADTGESPPMILILVRDRGNARFDRDDVRSLRLVGRQLQSLLDRGCDRERLQAAERERDVARAVLDTVLETAPIGFAFHDPEFRFLGINTRLAAVNGLTASEHLGRTLEEVVPDLASGLLPRLRHVLETGESLVDLDVVDEPDDEHLPPRHWRTTHYPIRLPDGELIGVGAVVTDVTDQHQADEALRSRLRQQEAVAALGQRALLGDGDEDDLFDAACQIAAETLQVPYAALLEVLPDGETSLLRNGVGWPEGIVGEARVAIDPTTQVGIAILTNEPVIVDDLPAEAQYHGATRLLEWGIVSSINVLIAGRDRPWGVLSAHSTRQRQFSPDDIHFLQSIANVLSASIERNLVEHERQLLLDSANEGIFGINIDGICTYINQAALDLLGYTADECLGRNMHELTHYKRADGSPYPTEECPIYQAMWSGTSERLIDETLWRKDGTPLPALYSCSSVIEHGRVTGAVVTIVDLREQQRIELALRESLERAEGLAQAEQEARHAAEAAVAVREEFLSIASHELKTPLTTIKATAQLLDRRLRLPEVDLDRILRHAELLQREISRLETLVDDLLNATHIQRGRLELRPEEIDLVELARLAITRFEHALERRPGHQIVLDSPERADGWFDPGRMDQVLTNLISNALKYSPSGGEVRVMIRERDALDGSHARHAEARSVEISVSDQGIGISAKEQSQLFQPFARGADIRQSIRGSGLGLYIAARIVTQHGGTIRVESALGEGSTFIVRLPVGATSEV